MANYMNNNDDKLIDKSRRLLDERVDKLGDNVITRLRAARLRATEVADRKNTRPAWIKPVGGLVTATLVVGIATSLWMANPSVPNNGIEDLDILASSESPEFYQDLDFYLWLEERSRAG